MKKGFTLMEILAVILVIAVIASFAAPVFRAVREELQYHRAQSAALKMGEAIRSFYKDSKGFLVYSAGMTGADLANLGDGTCNNPADSGVPRSAITDADTLEPGLAQLFYCGYLTPKDFAGLPYTFVPNTAPHTSGILLTVTGTENAGKYSGHSFTVKRDSTIEDVE